MKDTRFSKLLLLINGLVPLVLLLWDVYRKQVGANPLEFVTRTTGMLTLVFLMITLAITPVRKITGLNWTWLPISGLIVSSTCAVWLATSFSGPLLPLA